MLKLLTFILIFFSLAQPGILFPSIARYRIFFIIASVSIVLLLFQRFSSREGNVSLPQDKYIIGMLLAYTLSEAQFLWLSGTITVFIFWLKRVMLYFLIVFCVRDIKDLRKGLWFVIMAVIVLTVLGWKMFLFEPYLLHNHSRLQSVGNYNLSNSFALVLAVVVPLVLALLETERRFLRKIFLFLLVIVFAITASYTKSRGGCLGLIIGIILYVFTSKGTFSAKPIKVFVITLSLVGFVGFIIPMALTRSDVGSYTGGDSSAGDRKLAWVAAVKMFIDHPVAGVGWGKFNENIREYGHDKKLLAHNTPLSVLAETGIVGFACFFAILYYTFKQLWQIRKYLIVVKEKSDLLILTQGVLISFVCFMINTSFSVKDHDPIYWVLLSLSGAIIGIFQREIVVLNK